MSMKELIKLFFLFCEYTFIILNKILNIKLIESVKLSLIGEMPGLKMLLSLVELVLYKFIKKERGI